MNTARFLKYVWSFFIIMNERFKEIFTKFGRKLVKLKPSECLKDTQNLYVRADSIELNDVDFGYTFLNSLSKGY